MRVLLHTEIITVPMFKLALITLVHLFMGVGGGLHFWQNDQFILYKLTMSLLQYTVIWTLQSCSIAIVPCMLLAPPHKYFFHALYSEPVFISMSTCAWFIVPCALLWVNCSRSLFCYNYSQWKVYQRTACMFCHLLGSNWILAIKYIKKIFDMHWQSTHVWTLYGYRLTILIKGCWRMPNSLYKELQWKHAFLKL